MTKSRFLWSIAVGGCVGALVGGVEALVWLFQIPWWLLDTPVVLKAMGFYGALSAAMALGWALGARRLDQPVFERRTIIFSISAMVFVFGGFYANRLWFPEIYTLPSLLFTGIWTLGWLVGVWALGTVKTLPREGRLPGRRLRLWVAAVALLVVAASSLVPPHLWSRAHRVTDEARGPGVKRPNIVLIVMDTTRADRLSSYGYPRNTTPNLDRLAAEGVLFEQASAPSPWTLPSHASLLTGLYPSQHGADWSHQRLDDQFVTLAELLGDQGYQTAAFVNNPFVSRATNFQQGFDYFQESWHGGRAVNRLVIVQVVDKLLEVALQHRDDDADLTTLDIKRWFKDAYEPPQPFFLFVNYLEPHFVYEPPQPYRGRFLGAPDRVVSFDRSLERMKRLPPPVRFTEAQQEFLSDLYDGEIAYLDARIGEVLEVLKRRRLLDETVVIVTSDHGESLGEHEIFQHQFCLYETLLRVPLIVRYPDAFPPGTRVNDPVSLVDLMPTLMALLQFEDPSLHARLPGKRLVGSALKIPRDRAVIAQHPAPTHLLLLARVLFPEGGFDEHYFARDLVSLRRRGLKFIWSSDGQHELYDLSRDPQETENLITTLPDFARSLEAELEAHREVLKPAESPEPVPALDEVTREKLRSLGYLQ